MSLYGIMKSMIMEETGRSSDQKLSSAINFLVNFAESRLKKNSFRFITLCLFGTSQIQILQINRKT